VEERLVAPRLLRLGAREVGDGCVDSPEDAEHVSRVLYDVGDALGRRRAAGCAGAQAQGAWRYKPFFHAMLDAGVYLPPSAFECWFVSTAHDDGALSRIAEALPGAARAAVQAHQE